MLIHIFKECILPPTVYTYMVIVMHFHQLDYPLVYHKDSCHSIHPKSKSPAAPLQVSPTSSPALRVSAVPHDKTMNQQPAPHRPLMITRAQSSFSYGATFGPLRWDNVLEG